MVKQAYISNLHIEKKNLSKWHRLDLYCSDFISTEIVWAPKCVVWMQCVCEWVSAVINGLPNSCHRGVAFAWAELLSDGLTAYRCAWVWPPICSTYPATHSTKLKPWRDTVSPVHQKPTSAAHQQSQPNTVAYNQNIAISTDRSSLNNLRSLKLKLCVLIACKQCTQCYSFSDHHKTQHSSG